jgi:hypothetical protein
MLKKKWSLPTKYVLFVLTIYNKNDGLLEFFFETGQLKDGFQLVYNTVKTAITAVHGWSLFWVLNN